MSVARVSWARSAACLGTSAAIMLLGCGPKKAPTLVTPPPPITNPRPAASSDVAVRVRNLSRESDNLADDSRKLPGRDAGEHRKLMARVLTDLSQTLPLLGDPAQDRVLAQRLTVIQNSRAQLEHGSTELSAEPTIDTGLRAASAALADLSHSDYYDQAELGPLLDKLSAQIDKLDLDHGPLHSVDVADAVDQTSQIVSKMAAALGERVAAEHPAAASQPATTASGGK